MAGLADLVDPHVEQYLLTTEDEFIVDQVHRHWVCRLPGAGLVLLGSIVALFMPRLGAAWPLALVGALGLAGWGLWKVHVETMRRFVVTNVRAFRVEGVFNQQMSSVPLARIVDITVERPLPGMLLGYGHFAFESAGVSGMKHIEYVPDINRRATRIETVIQRAGLRTRMGIDEATLAEVLHEADADDPHPHRVRAAVRRLRPRREQERPDPNEMDGY